MKLMLKCFMVLVFFALAAGCSIKHPVARDYDKYLSNNQGGGRYEKTSLKADYSLTSETAAHRYEFRSATVGYANLWIVEFGKMLDSTLQSKDIQESFGRLTKTQGSGETGSLIIFDLKKYEFVNYGAHVALAVSVSSNGRKVFDKTYQSDGKTQGGKMFIGGAFAMKNAIQQSTKFAIDTIMADFIRDINKSKLRP